VGEMSAASSAGDDWAGAGGLGDMLLLDEPSNALIGGAAGMREMLRRLARAGRDADDHAPHCGHSAGDGAGDSDAGGRIVRRTKESC